MFHFGFKVLLGPSSLSRPKCNWADWFVDNTLLGKVPIRRAFRRRESPWSLVIAAWIVVARVDGSLVASLAGCRRSLFLLVPMPSSGSVTAPVEGEFSQQDFLPAECSQCGRKRVAVVESADASWAS